MHKRLNKTNIDLQKATHIYKIVYTQCSRLYSSLNLHTMSFPKCSYKL